MNAKRFGFLAMGLALLGLLIPSSAFALQVDSSPRFSVFHERDTFTFSVQNTSNEEKPLLIGFFGPMRYSITAPQTIPANSGKTIRININNYPDLYNTTYETQFTVALGNETQNRKVLITFSPPLAEPEPEPAPEPEPSPIPQPNPLSGLAVFFGAIHLELALQIILAIILVILCVALVARMYNIAKGDKK